MGMENAGQQRGESKRTQSLPNPSRSEMSCGDQTEENPGSQSANAATE